MNECTVLTVIATLVFAFRLRDQHRPRGSAKLFGLASTLSLTAEIAMTVTVGHVLLSARADFASRSINYLFLACLTYTAFASSLWACLILKTSADTTLEAADPTKSYRNSWSMLSALVLPCSIYAATVLLAGIVSTDFANRL